MRATVTISLDKRTLDKARANAKRARRSVSSEFECAMEDRLENLAQPGVELLVLPKTKPRKSK